MRHIFVDKLYEKTAFMTALQKSHLETNNKQHNKKISLIAENIRTPENLGMILRISEAFGVAQIYFVGQLGVELTTKAKRASRNTYKKDNFEFIADADSLINDLKTEGARLIAVEITNNSQPMLALKVEKDEHLVLIIGSEREGISQSLLAKIPEAYHIDMYGENSSLNVTNALAIALYQTAQ